MKDKYKEYYGHSKFYEIIEELAELHSKKNHQYATQDDPLANFKRCGKMTSKLFKDSIKNKPLAVCLSYMGKQIDGIYEMVGEGKIDVVEELKDKLMDVAVYSIIAIIINEECNDE